MTSFNGTRRASRSAQSAAPLAHRSPLSTAWRSHCHGRAPAPGRGHATARQPATSATINIVRDQDDQRDRSVDRLVTGDGAATRQRRSVTAPSRTNRSRCEDERGSPARRPRRPAVGEARARR